MDLDDIDDFDPDGSEYEPTEWDPETALRDPESDWPTIPEVSTSESDAPVEVARTFWAVVLVVNVAVLFVSVGPMLIYFWGDWRIGLTLVVGGIFLFALAYRRSRRFLREGEGDEDGGDGRAGSTPGTANGFEASEEPGTMNGSEASEEPMKANGSEDAARSADEGQSATGPGASADRDDRIAARDAGAETDSTPETEAASGNDPSTNA